MQKEEKIKAEILRLNELNKKMIDAFREYDTCYGGGPDWFHKREKLWNRYVIHREIFMRASAKEYGCRYLPLPTNLDNFITQAKSEMN